MQEIRAKGFTLVELMTVIVILAILTAIAFPSFQSSLRSNRVATTSNELMASLALARSEAIRAGSAGICASENGEECATSEDWNEGWLVWTDNGNQAKDEGEPVVRHIQAHSKLLVTASEGTMIFDARGRIVDGAQSIGVKPADGEDDTNLPKRCVYVSATGQMRVAKEACQ